MQAPRSCAVYSPVLHSVRMWTRSERAMCVYVCVGVTIIGVCVCVPLSIHGASSGSSNPAGQSQAPWRIPQGQMLSAGTFRDSELLDYVHYVRCHLANQTDLAELHATKTDKGHD